MVLNHPGFLVANGFNSRHVFIEYLQVAYSSAPKLRAVNPSSPPLMDISGSLKPRDEKSLQVWVNAKSNKQIQNCSISIQQ